MENNEENRALLWDRLSELADGNLWNKLTKEEWKLAQKLFDPIPSTPTSDL